MLARTIFVQQKNLSKLAAFCVQSPAAFSTSSEQKRTNDNLLQKVVKQTALVPIRDYHGPGTVAPYAGNQLPGEITPTCRYQPWRDDFEGLTQAQLQKIAPGLRTSDPVVHIVLPKVHPINACCLFRLAAGPAIGTMIIAGNFPLAYQTFWACMIMDCTEWSLRKFTGQMSKTSGWITPLADTSLMFGTFVPFMMIGMVPGWFGGPVLFHELARHGMNYYRRSKALGENFTWENYFDRTKCTGTPAMDFISRENTFCLFMYTWIVLKTTNDHFFLDTYMIMLSATTIGSLTSLMHDACGNMQLR